MDKLGYDQTDTLYIQILEWLKAGIIEKGQPFMPEMGTPQGGVLSPLLANVALHGKY